MAHIQDKRDKGRGWVVRYVDDEDRQRSRSFPRKTDAEAFRDTVASDVRRGEWIDPELAKTPFRNVAEGWLTGKANLKPSTRATYRTLLDVHLLPAFGARAVGEIRAADVRTWVAKLSGNGLGAAQVRHAFGRLRVIFQLAVVDKMIGRSPCVGIDLPRLPEREMRFLTPEQVGMFADAVPGRYLALVFALAYGGMRFGEAAALRVENCDLLRRQLRLVESLTDVKGKLVVGPLKTHAARTVAIPPSVADIIAAHIAQYAPRDAKGEPRRDALVFTGERGKPLRVVNFNHRVWAPVRAELAEEDLVPADVRIHDLRHTAAALMIRQDRHMLAVMKQLGHKQITTTQRYSHLYADELDKTADALERAFSAGTKAGRGKLGGDAEGTVGPQLEARQAN